MVLRVAFAARAQYIYLVSFVVECASFFPNTPIERNGEILDNYQDFVVHKLYSSLKFKA